jgi:6-phosphogluconate dehydrogenase (decarboxylating)
VLPDVTQPTLSGSCSLPDFNLQVSNAAPGVWTVERTSDFVIWTPLLTTNTRTAEWNVTDEVSSLAQFYRVVGQP